MKIQKAKGPEVITRLDREIFVEPFGDAEVEADRGSWWVAVDEKAGPVGFAGIRQLTHEPEFAVLERAGILPDFRGQGLHRRLIRARLRWARAQGIENVITYTTVDNAPSANSLIGTGFRLYCPQWRWAGDAFVYWHLVL